MDERTFLERDKIKVTSARFVVGAQTYAMASVNSVKIQRTDITQSNTFPGLMVIVGAIWLFVHMMLEPAGVLGYLWPLALLGLGVWWISSIKKTFQYKLVLTTSSGETPVLVSTKSDDILPVEKALTDAIVYRG
jgi:hypothetical protein